MNPGRAALCLLFVSAFSAQALDLYVSPKGSDQGAGTEAAPFATLGRARQEIRDRRAHGLNAEPVTVNVRAGLYELGETFSLDQPEDSGSAQSPVTWRGYEKERPLVTGGVAVTGWKRWKGEILQADLPAMKGKQIRQLLFNGKRQPLARYPNFDPANPTAGGWAYVAGEMWPMYADKEGEDKKTLAVKPEDWRTWARPSEVEVFIFPRFNWWNDILRVASVDPAAHTVTTTSNASYAMRPNDRYYFQNALEELDAPGEWYFDKTAGTLYFWPPAPIEGSTVLVPRLQNILALEKVSDVTLRGLEFACAEGTAIELRNCGHCTVADMIVHDVGGFSGNGVNVNGGSANGVIGCDISNLGRNGISLSGGDTQTLTAAGNFADNCYIHHPGIYYKQGVGVALAGVGQRVSHCLIHDTPRFAIQYSGQKHILEYNHLRHLALETEDVGATYGGGRDWLGSRGTIIRYNYIHDVRGFGWNGQWTSPYFAWGIYLDDNSGGVDVIGNIVARCGRSLIHGHSARDCRVENNIFVEGGLRQWEFNGWTTKQHFWESNFEQMLAAWKKVQDVPAWQQMRGMSLSPADTPNALGQVMSGNEIHRNIIAWKNPESKALNVANFDAARNHADDNLYWHHGLPLLTGQHSHSGPPISENLLANPTFAGEPGKLPTDWSWQIRPKPEASAFVAEEDGRRYLQMDAAFNEAKARDNYPIVASKQLALTPGGSYRLSGRMRSAVPGAKANLMLQCYVGAHDGKPGFFWASSPSEAVLTPEWKEYVFDFSIPHEGERGWSPEMKLFRARIDWKEKTGSLQVESPVLQQVESMDEWASWREMGDRHSVVADPLFVDPEHDDYHLRPASPAYQIGFQPLPIEMMGPYADPLRATWPIVEAPGEREVLAKAGKGK